MKPALLVVLTGLAGAAMAADQPALLNQPAPELTGRPWLNTPQGAPVKLSARRGQVTVVHFWTFECVNCRRNLPIYTRWQEKFRDRRVLVIGVHTPELPEERIADNVARRAAQLGVTYPVLLDPDYENWRRWNQRYWPAVYLIDKQGRIRARWEGEMNWGKLDGEARMTRLIEQLLDE